MIYWANELIKMAEEMSDNMELWSDDAPRDTEGHILAGTPEVRRFNRCVFALSGAIEDLKRAMHDINNEEF